MGVWVLRDWFCLQLAWRTLETSFPFLGQLLFLRFNFVVGMCVCVLFVVGRGGELLFPADTNLSISYPQQRMCASPAGVDLFWDNATSRKTLLLAIFCALGLHHKVGAAQPINPSISP